MRKPTIDAEDADALLKIMQKRAEAWFIRDLMTETGLHPRDILLLLIRLEDRGQVSSAWAPPEKGLNSPRRAYSLAAPLTFAAQGN